LNKKNEYIKLTMGIRKKIKEERIKKGLSSIELSKKYLGKSNSYISHIEHEVTKKIKKDDLIKIFKIILGIDDKETIEKYINELISDPIISEKEVIIYRYDEDNKSSTKESFKDMLGKITDIFNIIYDNNPEYAFDCVGQYMENLQFDTGFTLALNKIPFNEILKNSDHEIRQQLFNKIGDAIKKHLIEYGKKNNNSSEDESTDESEDSSEDT